MLRRGVCYRQFPIRALGDVPMVEIYGVIRDSRANADRIRRYGPAGGVDPRSLISFYRTGKCRFFIALFLGTLPY